MKPSETSRGQSWLTNFPAWDVSAATLLLDSVHVVPQSTIRTGLQGRIDELLSDQTISGPAMVIPALSIEDLRAQTDARPPRIAFDDFDPAARISSTPGSEGVLGNLVRDLTWSTMGQSGKILGPVSSTDALKDAHARSIVLLADYSGSGKQVRRFANTFVRNSTIRSWRSFGLIRIHVLMYAASSIAIDRLRRTRSIDVFWVVEPAATMSGASWTAVQRDAVEALCLRYAHAGREDEALGYKGSRGLFLTDASVPNNLPVVLRQTGQGWHSFFDERTVPIDVASAISGYQPTIRVEGTVARARQPRLAEQLSRKVYRSSSRRMLVLLALLANQRGDPATLAEMTGWPLAEVNLLSTSLSRLGFLDANGDVTANGRLELVSGKRALRVVTASAFGSEAPYYPVSMR